MTVTDDELVERIRSTLRVWAEEAPVTNVAVSPADEPIRAKPTRFRFAVRLATIAAVAVLVLAAAIVWSNHRPSEMLVAVGSNPTTVTEIPVGQRHGVKGIAVTDDAVWMTSHFDEMLYRIDPTTNDVVASYPIPSHVEGISAAGGWLWLSRYDPDELVRVDPDTGALTARLVFDSQPALAADGEQLWVIAGSDNEGHAFRVDPTTATVTTDIPLDGAPGFAAVSGDTLWVAHHGTSVVSRVDLAEGRVSDTIDVGGEPRPVVVSDGAVWVGVNGGGVADPGWVARIDPATARVTTRIVTGRGIHSLAATADALWVTNQRDGTLSVIDTRTAELVATTPIGDTPGALAVGHGSVWMAPHRDAILLRVDPAMPLESAARPDVARAVEVSAGTMYLRCSGSGSPTVVLEADASYGAGSWAVVEARLAHQTRVCASDRVGIADRDQAGQAGPATTAASDLHDALAQIGEHGPFVIVGRGFGGLNAQMFAANYDEQVVGLVLVNSPSADFYDRIRVLLPADALEKFEQSLVDDPTLRFLEESSAQVAAASDLGDLPLVVVADPPLDPITASANSDPPLTVAEIQAIDALRQVTQREQVTLSTQGRLVHSADPHETAQVVVEEVRALLGAGG